MVLEVAGSSPVVHPKARITDARFLRISVHTCVHCVRELGVLQWCELGSVVAIFILMPL